MRLTGLSEFLWFLLIFGAMFAFTVWRQQRDRRRREERLAAMSPPEEVQPAAVSSPTPTVPEAWSDISWGRGPTVPEPSPDTSWGRGPAVPVPPPEVTPDWRDVPVFVPPAPLPPRAAPTPSKAPRRPAPTAARVAGRGAMQFRSEAGLRQAMIALTVLGPCRALEPYGGEAPPGPGNASRSQPRPQGR